MDIYKKLEIPKCYDEIRNVITKIAIEHNISTDNVVYENKQTLDGNISGHIFEILSLLESRKQVLQDIEAERLLSMTPDNEVTK